MADSTSTYYARMSYGEMMKDNTKNLYHERILSVLVYIQNNLDEHLSLEQLAQKSYFSPIHFHRIFKGMMGETLVEHIRRIRLERAAARLAAEYSTVTEAAFDSGYETVESFSRAFKKMFGCPPSKYPEQHWDKLYRKIPSSVHYTPAVERGEINFQLREVKDMKVEQKSIESIRVAFVRHTGPYSECLSAWKTLCDWAAPKGLLRSDSKYLGIGHDDPQVTAPEKLRYDACVEVENEVEGENEIGIQTIPAGKYAVYLHKGPYELLEKTYARLMGQWLPQSGKEMGDTVCFEVYLNSPENTPSAELLTEIHLPLK